MNDRGLRTLSGWAVLTGVLVLGLLPALLARDLWSSDEHRYVEVAREAARYGHVLVPHLNGDVYAEKPPLFFWLTAALGALVRDFGVGGRLTAWLATAWTAFVVVRVGWRLGLDPRRAWLGGLIYLTLPAVFERGQEALLDPLLAACALTAVGAALEALAAPARAQAGAWTVATWLALTAGCLTKGPVVLLSPWAAGLALFARRSDWRAALALGIATSAVALMCTVGWVGWASSQVGDWYWDTLIFRQTAGRIGQATVAHREPFHFYLAQLPLKTMPWFLLLPGLAISGRGASPARRARLFRLLSWLGLGLGVLSCVGSKRFGYALPLLPPFALACAEAMPLTPATAGTARRRLLDAPLALCRRLARVTLGLGALGSAWFVAIRVLWAGPFAAPDSLAAYLETPAGLTWLVWSACLALLVAWLLGPECLGEPGQPLGDAIGLGLTAALVGSLVLGVVAATRNERESLRGFVAALRQQVRDPAQVRLLGYHQDGRFNLYLEAERLPVVTHAELEAGGSQSDPGLLIASDQTWAAVTSTSRARFEVSLDREVGRRRRWLLLR